MTDYLIACDLTWHTIATILPQDWYERTDYSTFVMQTIFFMLWYTQHRSQVIIHTFFHFMGTIIVPGVFFMQEMTMSSLILKTSFVLTAFLTNVLFASALIYISTLQKKMKSINKQNLRLLDGMHEGLLIVSKAQENSSREALYCNEMASKLLLGGILHVSSQATN